MAAGAVPVAVKVRLNVPAWVGVPDKVAVPEFAPPEVNTTPVGRVPAASEIVGVGTPEAPMLKVVPATFTVNPPKLVGVVKDGGTGASDGVNAPLGADATLVPPALVAVTVQV